VKIHEDIQYEDVWERRDVAPHILNLGTRWRWVVKLSCFAPRDRAPGTPWL